MEVAPLILVVLLLAVFAAGGTLGYLLAARTHGTAGEAARLLEARDEAAQWRAQAAESRGRAEVLERENTELAEVSRRDQALAAMIAPLAAKLTDMTDRVAAMHTQQTRAEAAMREQLGTAVTASQELSRETSSLRTVLTSHSARGTWGEVELRRIVEAAGMLPHVDFSEQQSTAVTARATSASVSGSALTSTGEGGGSSARPDVTIHLPGGTHIAIDAKVPLAALLRAEALEGSDDRTLARRAELRAEHARALREHIKDLVKRDYPAQFPGSPRLTILFLPSESLLSEALNQDPALLEDAMRAGIAPASPTSLLALLRSVAAVWSSAKATDEAQEILALGKTLVTRLSTVAEHMDKLGGALSTAVDRYNRTVASLESRVLVTARRFESIDVTVDSPRQIDPDAAQIRALTSPELSPVHKGA